MTNRGKALCELGLSDGDVVECVESRSISYTTGGQYTIGGCDDNGCHVRAHEGAIHGLFKKVTGTTGDAYDVEWGPWIGWNGGECPVDIGTDVITLDVTGCMSDLSAEDVDWQETVKPWSVVVYRVKRKPVVGTETLDVFYNVGFGVEGVAGSDWPATHRLTFTTRDGKPATGRFENEAGDVITMERIGGDA